jgi:anti-sigma regulatory factor (Ser/Thr protein kinase)
MTIAHNQGGPCLELERSLPSEVAAISPFVDKLMLLIRKCGCAPEGEGDVEIALREALANAIIHGNMRILENTSMFVAAVNLTKSRSRSRTRDEDLTLI